MPKVSDEELNGAAAALLGLHTRNGRWAREKIDTVRDWCARAHACPRACVVYVWFCSR